MEVSIKDKNGDELKQVTIEVTSRMNFDAEFTPEERSKLEGIEYGANNYVHPATHSMSEISGLTASLDSKVDEVQGKGLSENDFTNHRKSWLEELPKYLWRQRNAEFKRRVLSEGGTIIHDEIEDQINLTIFSELFYIPIEYRVLGDWKGSQVAFDALVILEKDRKYHVMDGNEVIKTYIG